MKKIIALVLAICCMFSVLAISASASDETTMAKLFSNNQILTAKLNELTSESKIQYAMATYVVWENYVDEDDDKVIDTSYLYYRFDKSTSDICNITKPAYIAKLTTKTDNDYYISKTGYYLIPYSVASDALKSSSDSSISKSYMFKVDEFDEKAKETFEFFDDSNITNRFKSSQLDGYYSISDEAIYSVYPKSSSNKLKYVTYVDNKDTVDVYYSYGSDNDKYLKITVTDVTKDSFRFACDFWNSLLIELDVELPEDDTVTVLFDDVKDSKAWYYKAVNDMASYKVFAGYKDGNFGPDDKITREDFVVALSKAYAAYKNVSLESVLKEYNDTEIKFSDVKADAYYARAIAWATDKGIISGYVNGKFGVNDFTTREDLVVMIEKAVAVFDIYVNAPRTGFNPKSYSDYNKISDYATDSIDWALRGKVISGESGKYINPQGKTTRAQVAQIFYNIYENQRPA